MFSLNKERMSNTYITSGLLAYFNPKESTCYPGTGDTITSLQGSGVTGTLYGSYSYNSNGTLRVTNNKADYQQNGSTLKVSTLTGVQTIMMWLRVESIPSATASNVWRYLLDGRTGASQSWIASATGSDSVGTVWVNGTYYVNDGAPFTITRQDMIDLLSITGTWMCVTVMTSSGITDDFNFFGTSAATTSSVGLDCSFGPILMYNRELSAAEVHQNYQASAFAHLRQLTQPFIPRVSNALAAYFNLNNVTSWNTLSSGSTAYSIAGTGITGTFGGTYYVNSNGTVRILNNSTDFNLNQSGFKVSSVTNIRTISLWFRIESIPAGTSAHRHLLDARNGLGDGWIASAAVPTESSNGLGTGWRNGTFYVNGGNPYPITRQNMIDLLGVVGSWMNVTLICASTFTDNVEFFMTNLNPISGQFGYQGLDVTMGPILMYNRALTETEVQQNFLASEFFFLRQWTKYPSMPLKANVSNGCVASASSELTGYPAYAAFDQSDADYALAAIPGKFWHSTSPGYYDFPSGQFVNRMVSFSSDTGRMLAGPTLSMSAGGFTAVVWVRMTGSTLGHFERVFDFGNGAGVDNIGLARNGQTAQWVAFVNNGGATTLTNPTARGGTIQQNIWSLMAIRYNTFPAALQLYQNGALVETDSQAYPLIAASSTNTWSSYTASASTEHTSAWAAWKAFDGDLYSSWHSTLSAGVATPYNETTGELRYGNPTTTIDGTPRYGEYLQIQMPVSIFLGYFTLTARSDTGGASWYISRVPRVFYLAGSNNNGSTWTLLYAQTDSNFTWTSITQTFTLNPVPTTAYNTFRLVVASVGNPGSPDRSSVQIGDWKLGSVMPARILIPGTSNGNYIGRSNWSTDASANMDLGGLLLYDRPLSDAEIGVCTAVLKGQSPAHELPTSPKVQLLMRDLAAQPSYQTVSSWNSFTQPTLSLQPVFNALPYTLVDGAPLTGDWLQLRLPTPIVPSGMVLAPRRETDNPASSVLFAQRSPSTFVVAGSNDGVNWKLVYGTRSMEWLTENPRLLTLPQSSPTPGFDYPYHNLSSNTMNGYVASQSSAAAGTEFAWKAFDGNPATHWHTAWDSAANLYNSTTGLYTGTTTSTVDRATIAGEWLQIQFPQDYQSFLVTGFRIAPRRDSVVIATVRSPRYFVLAASNDGDNWVSLFDNRNDSPGANAWSRTTALTFSLPVLPSVTYRFFRLIVTRVGNFDNDTANNSANSVQINDFRLIGQPVQSTTMLFPLINLTANTSGTYVASASNTTGDARFEPFSAFDGDNGTMFSSVYINSSPNVSQLRYNGTTGFYPADGLTATTIDGQSIGGEWLQIQFPDEYANFILTGFRITPRQDAANTTRSPRNFVLAASPNGVLWTALYDNRSETGANDWGYASKMFTLSVAQIPVVTYRYYRLVVTRVGNLENESPADPEKSFQVVDFRLVGRPVNLIYFPLAPNNTGMAVELPQSNLTRSNSAAQAGILQGGSRSAGIATIVTNWAHGLTPGAWVQVSSNDASFNVSSVLVISVPSLWTFSYANPGSDTGVISLSGSIAQRAISADLTGEFAANASSSSTMQAGNYAAHHAFDGNGTTFWHSVYHSTESNYQNFLYTASTGTYAGQTTTTSSGSTISGEWLQLQVPPDHETVVLTGFRITPRKGDATVPPMYELRSPRNFAMVASADGLTWTTLYSNLTSTGVNNWTSDPQAFSLQTLPTTSYRYYRLVITRVGNYDSIATNTQESVQITELKFLGYSPRSTAITTLSNYTVTSSPTLYSDNFVDVDVNSFWPGAWGTGLGYNGSTGQYSGTASTPSSGRTVSGDWLQIQFPSESANFIATGFRIVPRQDATLADRRSPRNFVLAASPNGTNWVTLFDNTSSTTGIKNWTLAGHTFVLPTRPTMAYRYYRLIVTRIGNYDSDGSALQLAVQIADWRLIGEPVNTEAYSHYRLVVQSVGSPALTAYRDSLQLTEWNIFGTEQEDLLSRGLIAYFNPNLTSSYSGTGTTLTSTIGSATATLSGTYSFVNGTIRLTNSDSVAANNTSRLQLSLTRGVRTVSLWFKLETTNNSGTRVLLDARTGATNGLLSNTSVGSDWANSVCYVNEGKSLSLTLANLSSFFASLKNNMWTHLTLVSNSPFNDDLTLFADYLGTSGVDCTFGPVLVYNRTLSLAEHVQIFNAPQHTYLRNQVRDYVVDGLIAYFNPNITASYPGTGSTLTSLVGSGVTATLFGTADAVNFQAGSGTILISNASATQGNNTAGLQLDTLVNVVTISMWIKLESARAITRFLIDARVGSNAWVKADLNDPDGRIGSDWINGLMYVNGGTALPLTGASTDFVLGRTNMWWHLTFVTNTPITDDITLFSRTSRENGVDCLFGPIMVYNRVLSRAENIQNYQASAHLFFRGMYHPLRGLPSYVTLVPAMTADSSNGYVASASSTLPLSGWEPFRAFDSSLDSGWHSAEPASFYYNSTTGAYQRSPPQTTTVSGVAYNGEWLQIQVNTSIILTSFSLTGRAQSDLYRWRSPNDFIVAGSNDGSTWFLVFSTTNTNWSSVTQTFWTSSTTAYTYYRLITQKVGNSNETASRTSVQIHNWNLFAAMNEVGYFASASSAHASGIYNPLKLFDKTTDSDSAWVTSESASNLYSSATGLYLTNSTSGFTASGVAYKGEWFQFQLSTAISLSSLTLTPRQITTAWESSAPTSFIVAASNTGSDWTLVYTSGTFDWANRQTRVFTLPQPTSTQYLYFRVLVLRVGNSYLSVKGTTVMLGEASFCERDMTLTRFPVLPLTADTSNGYVASSSSVISAGYEAFNQFDLVDIDYTTNQSLTAGYMWHSALVYNDTTGNYTGSNKTTVNGFDLFGEHVQLLLPAAVTLSAFMITPRRSQTSFNRRSPRDFSIAASSDGANWDLVYRTFDTVWTSEYPRMFTLSSPTTQAYTYYRLIIESVGNSTTSSGQDSAQITEWALFGMESPTAAYYHPIRALVANESLGYVASASSSHSAAYLAFKAFDLFSADYDANLNLWATFESTANGYNTTSGLYTGTSSTRVDGFSYPGEWLQLELPYRITLTQFRLTPRRDTGFDARSPTDFIVAGSNDGYRWSVVYSTWGLISWATEDPRTFTVSGVNTPYRFYRLIAKIIGNTGVTGRTYLNLTEWNLFGPEASTNTNVVSVTSSTHKYGDTPVTLSSSLISGVPAWVSFTRANQHRLLRSTAYTWNMNLGFTAVALVRFRAAASGSGFERIFDFGQGPNGVNYNISLGRNNSSAQLRFQFVSAGPTNAVASIIDAGNIVRNAWTLVACRYEYNTRMELYQNNTIVGVRTDFSSYLPAGTISRDLNYVGYWNGQEFLQGDIAGLLVYNRALSPAELTTCGQVLLGATTNTVPLNPVYNLQASTLSSAASNTAVSSWGIPAFTQSVSGVQPVFQKTLVQYTSSNTSVATLSGAVATLTGVGSADLTLSDDSSNTLIRTLNVTKGDQVITFPGTDDSRPPTLSYFGSFAAGGTSHGQTTQSSDGYTVTVSSNYVTNALLASGMPQGGSPLYAFDGDVNSYWHSALNTYNSSTGVYTGSVTTTSSGQTFSGEWIQLQLPSATFIPTGFRILPRWQSGLWAKRSPRHFALVAGNDGTSWTTLFDNRATDGVRNWGNAAQSFAFPDLWATPYLYYRLVISRVGNSDVDAQNDQTSVELTEFRLLSNTLKTMVDADFDLGVTASSGLPVTLTSSNPAVAAVLPSGWIDILTVGSTVLTASQSGNDLYFAADDVQRTLTVTRAAQSITFSEFSPRTYSVVLSANIVTLPSTASSGLTITYSSSDPTVATVSGNVLTILESGSTNITAVQNGDGNYSAAVSVTRGLTVSMATQTITFTTLPLIKAVGSTFTLSATSSLGLPITYSVSPSNLLSFSGTVATVLATGTATVTASQVGQANQVTAASATSTITLVNTPNVLVGLGTDGNGSLLFSSDGGYNYLSANTYNPSLIGGRITSSAHNRMTNRLIAVSGRSSGTSYMTYSDDSGLTWNTISNLPSTSLSSWTLDAQKLSCTPTGTWLFSHSDLSFTLRSADNGLTWQTLSGTSSANAWNPISRRWVRAYGFGSYSDDDGVTWQNCTGFPGGVIAGINTIVRGDGTPFWIAVGRSTRTYWSEDGITWNYGSAYSPFTDIYDVGWNGSYWLAVGERYDATRSQAYQSYDGQNWSLVRNGGNEKLYNVGWTGSEWIIAGFTQGSPVQPFYRVSSDLWSWTSFRPMNTTVSAGRHVLAFPSAKFTQILTFPALLRSNAVTAPFTPSVTSTAVTSFTPIFSVPVGNGIVSVVNNGTQLQLTGAVGTVEVTVNQAETNAYVAASATTTLTVKAPQTLTFDAFSPVQYAPNTTLTLPATSSVGLTVTYVSSNPAVATVTNNTLTIVGAGTSDIITSQAGDDTYLPTEPMTQTLTVTKGTQTLTFPSIPNKTFGTDTTFSLSAITTSDLTVRYESSATGVATVSGNTVTIQGVGHTTITAYQDGDQRYEAATPVAQVLLVVKQDQLISFTLSAQTYAPNLTVTLPTVSSAGLTLAYASSNPAVATVTGNTLAVQGAGQCDITATQAGNTTVNAAPSVTRTLTVTQASQTIPLVDDSKMTAEEAGVDAVLTKTYGTHTTVTLPTTTDAGLSITYSSSDTTVATVTGNVLTIHGSGVTDVTGSQAGNQNYLSAVPVLTRLTVQKANQTVTFFSIAPKTYLTHTTVILQAASSTGLPLTFSSSNTAVATIDGSSAAIQGAGSALLTATQVGNSNYLPASATQTLSVQKAAQTLTITSPINKTLGDSPFTPSVSTSAQPSYSSYTFSVPADNGIASINGNVFTILAAGQVEITVTQAANSNFLEASAAATLVVAKKTQILTVSDVYRSYDDPPFIPTVSTNGTTLTTPIPYTISVQNPNVATVENGRLRIENVGSTLVTVTQSGDDTYTAATTTFTFTVEYGRRRTLLNLYDQTGTQHFQIAQEYTRTHLQFPGRVQFGDAHRSVPDVFGALVRIPQLQSNFANRLTDTINFESDMSSLTGRLSELDQVSLVTRITVNDGFMDTLISANGLNGLQYESLHTRIEESDSLVFSLTTQVNQTLTSTLSSTEYVTVASTNSAFTDWTILASEYLADGTINTGLNTFLREYSIDQSGVQIFARRNTDFVRSNDGGTSWSIVSNAPQVSLFAVPYGDSTGNTIFICGYNSASTWTEFFRTQNKGQSWTALPFPTTTISNTIPVLRFTTTGLYLMYHSAVYFSSSMGSTWTLRSTHTVAWSAFVTSTTGSVLFAADEQHVYRSTDGGVTWVQRTTVAQPYSVLACTADGQRIFALVPFPNQPIYTSNDSGASWTTLSAPNRYWVTISCSANGEVLCASSNQRGVGTLSLSVNYGNSWSNREILRPNPNSDVDYVRGVFDIKCSQDGRRVFGLSINSGVFLGSVRTITRLPVSPYLRRVEESQPAFLSLHTVVDDVDSSVISLATRVEGSSLQLPSLDSLTTRTDVQRQSLISVTTLWEEYELSLAQTLTRIESSESLIGLMIEQQEETIQSLASRIDVRDASWTTLLSEIDSWPSQLLTVELNTLTDNLPLLDSRILTLEYDVATIRSTLHTIVDADSDQHFSTLQDIITFFGATTTSQDALAIARRISHLESVILTLVSKLP